MSQCNNILARTCTCNVIDNYRVKMRYIELLCTLKAIKSQFSVSFNKQNFTLVVIWSFQTKLNKFAVGWFHKLHIK